MTHKEIEYAMIANLREALGVIARRLISQDNRCTDEPAFCVQEKRREYGYDPRWSDDTVWVDHESGEFDISEVEKDGYEETGYKDTWHTVMVSFTEEGCKDYLRQNGHNHGETRIYVESFRRCDEMIAVRKFLMGIAGDEVSGNEEQGEGNE